MPLLVASLSSLFHSLSCFRLWRRRHGFQTLSTLRKTKKPTLRKVASKVPSNLRFENQKSGDEAPASESQGRGGVGRRRRIEDLKGSIMAGILLVGFASDGYIYKDQINVFLAQFSSFIQGYGPAGYALFVLVYAEFEILAIPAIPLTMSAGLLFDSLTGTAIVSISGTIFCLCAILNWFKRIRSF